MGDVVLSVYHPSDSTFFACRLQKRMYVFITTIEKMFRNSLLTIVSLQVQEFDPCTGCSRLCT